MLTNIINWLADTFSVNNYIFILGGIIIFCLVAMVAFNNSKWGRTAANLSIIFLMTLLFGAVLTYAPVMEQHYVGKPNFNCQVFETDEMGNYVYKHFPLMDENGNKIIGTDGNPILRSEIVLKKYYLPNQDISLLNGILNLRLQYEDETGKTVERYCAFDIFPKVKKEKGDGNSQTPEQVAIKKWYNKLKRSKEMLDKANAIKNLSEMTDEEMEQIAKGMADENGIKQTVKADNNLDKFKSELGRQIQKRQAEQAQGEGEEGEGNEQGQRGQQGQGNQGMKAGKGLTITLPSTANNSDEMENNQEGMPSEGDEQNSGNNPNGSNWESSNGPDPSGGQRRSALPPKNQ